MTHIIRIEKLSSRHTAYTIEAPEAAKSASPGQVLLANFEGSQGPLPHPIADVQEESGTITFVGATHEPNEGNAVLSDFSGPVGATTAVETQGKVLCVGEGVGVAALLPKLREIKAGGAYTIVVVGYDDKDGIYWRDRFEELADELYVVTHDGSFGIKGPVQQVVRAVCESTAELERAYMVTPLDTLKATLKIADTRGLPTRVSLGAILEHVHTAEPTAEENGVGLVSYDWHNATDMDGQDVNFDDLIKRLGIHIKR